MITDLIMLAATVVFLIHGWQKGALKTLLGPISLVIACVAAYIYYLKTGNLLTTLEIAVLGPFAVRICLSLTLSIIKAASRKEMTLSFSSKLFGSLFSAFWFGSYMAFAIFMIGFIPSKSGPLGAVRNDVTSSRSYVFLTGFMDKRMPATSEDINKIAGVLEDPETVERLQSTPEFREIMADETLTDLYDDEETMAQIENKEYFKLLSNPKFQTLLTNEELIRKLLDLNQKIMEGSFDEGTVEPQSNTPPKVIEIK